MSLELQPALVPPVAPPLAAAPPVEKPSRSARLFRRLRSRLGGIFVFTVFVPTLLAAVYFGLIASDVYISESRFVVRSPNRAAQAGLSALLQGTGFTRSGDDTYSVHDYMMSRDAVHELEQQMGLSKVFSRPEIDVFNRFPGRRWWDRSFEALYLHYQDHVLIEYDTVSSISVLNVRAYTAEDAHRINDLLLKMGERLVNNLNDRSRQDLIEVAARDVADAEERAKVAAAALSQFRSKGSLVDPGSQSVLQLTSVAKMQEDLLAAEAQLAQIRQVSPSNPQIPSLESSIKGLRRAIESETGKVTSGSTSLMGKAPAFDRLMLEKGFAERQLASALAALDSARGDAQRKQLYLERLVQPNLPDKAMEPRRLRSVLTVFVLGLIAWGIVSLVFASVREHTD